MSVILSRKSLEDANTELQKLSGPKPETAGEGTAKWGKKCAVKYCILLDFKISPCSECCILSFG